jgi:RNA-binding protein YlmH
MTGDRGAQIIILPEECESLCSALRQIRSVPVDASRILLQDLKVKAQVVKEVIFH